MTVSAIFLTVVNMSISAGWVALAVLMLRLLLKKAPKWIAVLLWGVVAVRLVCPFTVESVLSLLPSNQTVDTTIMTDPTPQINSGIPVLNSAINPLLGSSLAPAPGASVNPLQIWVPVLAGLWIAGMAAMLVYTAVSCLRVKRRIGTAVRLRDNVFQSENVGSPFVFGLVKPKIYLPFSLSGQDEAYVIAHEQAHIRRKDQWWKPLGFLLLTVHWFNPLLWLGYILLCRDIELACDEKVVKEWDDRQKADYSQALLTCSVNRRTIAACPLAFGEVGVKNRVKAVLNYRKPAFWLVVTALVGAAAVAVCFLTDPKTAVDPQTISSRTYEVAEVSYEDGMYDFTVTAGENSPLYAITEDMQLSSQMEYENDAWTKLGQLQEITLDDKAFVSLFRLIEEHDKGGVKCLIRDTVRLWTLIYDQEHLYYVLQQNNGDRYLACGYCYDTETGDSHADTCHIRWLFKLKEVALSAVGGADSGKLTVVESTVSYANWTGEPDIFVGALNHDKLYQSSIHHLPIYKFDTLDDLNGFKNLFGDVLVMERGWDEVPSFNAVTAKYDTSFFENSSLLLMYVTAGNSTHRFAVRDVQYNEQGLSVSIVETTHAEMTDSAMAGWFVTVAVSDDLVKGMTEFDAYQYYSHSSSLAVLDLRQTHPHFFDLSTDGGLTVYVWEMAKDVYECHLASTALESVSDQSFIYSVGPATIEEMRLILASYDLPEAQITIQPVHHPLSSYYYEIDDAYIKKVRSLFGKDVNAWKEIPTLTLVTDDGAVNASRGTLDWTITDEDGRAQTVNADSPHPLYMRDYLLPTALKAGTTVDLRFSTTPDSVKVHAWRAEDDIHADPIAVETDGKALSLNGAGTWVYEVTATWSRSPDYYGTVRYAFYIQAGSR